MSGKNKFIKFLLIGITGDLSQRKILPALAQFAEKNEEVGVDLIGYSRSKPDLRKINLLLDKHSKKRFNSLESIEHIQGNYEDNTIFRDIIAKLEKNERLIAYLAVPPEVFVKFIINSCPFNQQTFDIIVEKPFGSDKKESERILTILEACELGKQIKFFDHYLFKNSVIYGQKELEKLAEYKDKKIEKIEIKALESLGVENRVSYYNSTGAIKDMLPHLYSLLKTTLNSLDREIDIDKTEVRELELKQYKDYTKELKTEESETETYFKSILEISSSNKGNQENFVVSLESGKKLQDKLTEINIYFDDKSEINWNINPTQQITFKNNKNVIILDKCERENYDHTNLFEHLKNNKNKNFVTPKEIKNSWEIYEKIIEHKNKQKIELSIY
jgi:glucose-6-phosphate 1-dehydrogenase